MAYSAEKFKLEWSLKNCFTSKAGVGKYLKKMRNRIIRRTPQDEVPEFKKFKGYYH